MNPRSLVVFGLALYLAMPATAHSQARYQIAVQAVGGLYIYNSENSLPLLRNGKFIGGYGIDASVIRSTDGPYGLALDVQYFRSNAKSPLTFTQTGEFGITFHGRVALDQFSADVGVRRSLAGWLQVGLGPSIAVESRTVEIPNAGIADRLDSYCLGLNAVAAATMPFHETSNRGFFWYYTVKLRYLHSIFFDARGRDLSDYSQSFLTASLGAGIGYAF